MLGKKYLDVIILSLSFWYKGSFDPGYHKQGHIFKWVSYSIF